MINTKNLKEVYVTADTHEHVNVWNPNIGIVKYKGCVEFRSSRSLGKTERMYSKDHVGQLGYCECLEDCSCSTCLENRVKFEEQFGFFPKQGTAWIVNMTTLKRKRIDTEMHLIDPDTLKILEEDEDE